MPLPPLASPIHHGNKKAEFCMSPRDAKQSAGTSLGPLKQQDDRARVSNCVSCVRDAEGLLRGLRLALAELSGDNAEAEDSMVPSYLGRPLLVKQAIGQLGIQSIGGGSLFDTKGSVASGPSSPRTRSSSPCKGKKSPLSTGVWAQLNTQTMNNTLMIDQVIINAEGQVEHERSSGNVGHAISNGEVCLSNTQDKMKKGKSANIVFSKWGIPILHPEAKRRLAWLCVGFVFLVYEVFAVPVYLSFKLSPVPGETLFIVTSVVNTYFILDIPMTFLTGFLDHQTGGIVMEPSSIASTYVKGWLALDVIAGVPWEWLSLAENSGLRVLRVVKAFRLLRLTRLVSLRKLRSSMSKFETFVEASKFFTFFLGVLRSITLLFAITHWAACIWFIVGQEAEKGRIDSNLGGSTIHLWQQYVYCLYFSWTTMTTVGYGDVTPETFSEVCFVLCLLVLSSIVFAYLMGSLTDLISNMNQQTHVLSEKKTQLTRYMQWRGVPRKLMMTIRQYLLFLWETNADYDAYEELVKEMLPPVLKTELCYHIYGRVIVGAPFFSFMKDYSMCVKHFTNLIQSIFLERGDVLFQMGHPNTQIYLLLTGRVWLSRNQKIFDEYHMQADLNLRQEGSGVDFSIPRSKDGMKLVDVDMNKYAKKFLPKTSRQAALSEAQKEKLHQANKIFVDVQAEEREKKKAHFGVEKTGHNMFDSEVLADATVKLMREDVRRKSAALRLQRCWRRSHGTGKFDTLDSKYTNGGRKLGILNKMVSKTVQAPAYFGESCLWSDHLTWELQEAPPYLYNARCESRCELVYIPRSAVLDVINHFNPWMGERFAYFRTAVLQGIGALDGSGVGCLNANTKHRVDPRCGPVDWAAADLEAPPVAETKMNVMHSQLLQRQASRRKLGEQGHAAPRVPISTRGDPSQGPAVPRVGSNLSTLPPDRVGSKLSPSPGFS